MKKYKQLTLALRYQIFAYKNENYTITKIAQLINVSKSTISRELNRNSNEGYYSAETAHIKAVSRDKFKHRYQKLTNKLKLKIGKMLRDGLSPEQLVGRLKKEKIAYISYETVYRYIYANQRSGGRLYKYLRHKNKKYGNRSSQYKTRGQIKNRVNISQRAKVVNNKSRFGDFEVDTIIGKDHQGAIVTLVDRKSKFTLMKIVESKKADVVTQAIIELLYPIRKLVHTITSDNGKEFSYHQDIAKQLNLKFYFCDPYSSWQRGLNEHTNGLVREYIPKKSSFENINQSEIIIIQNRLNNRPRKILKYYTPNEIFFKEVSRKMVA
ncbi:IS30 family transposase [Arcobacteraceae bacterium]|nr:IS30 family transposase [Arcobacteraceae bacterium]